MYTLRTKDILLALNQQGQVTSLYSQLLDRELSYSKLCRPLIQVSQDENLEQPASVVYDQEAGTLCFTFPSTVEVDIRVETREEYFTFEVVEVRNGVVKTLVWGPIVTVLHEQVGEVIGVACGQDYAVGIQALNRRTLGGWPEEHKSDLEQEVTEYGATSTAGFDYASSCGLTTHWGSILQAYVRNRKHPYLSQVQGQTVSVPPSNRDDSDLVGSKIALFGCQVSQVLPTIGRIEEQEGLPHPMIEGEWGKMAWAATRSYLITDFTEDSIEDSAAYAAAMGFKNIYHPDPFASWGRFPLKPAAFPDGDESMARCVRKAAEHGVGIGLHTLTNFTTTNDEYVTPVPHEKLQSLGQTVLACDVDGSGELVLEDDEAFQETSWLTTARIEQELVQYTQASDGRLTGCTRGAFGTEAVGHRAGTPVYRLADHAYRVFFPDLDLQQEYTERLVALYNNTRLAQISFDGLEGCSYTGHEDYAVNVFVDDCYQGWDHPVVNDASRLHHYLWHINTRMNWGEPWNAEMREGQIASRWKNQAFFKRNFLPPMLGWFLIRLASKRFAATNLTEVEWMLAKAAGFKAGFALCIDQAVLKGHGLMKEIVELVNVWEDARSNDVFPNEVCQALCEQQHEWHLDRIEANTWELTQVAVSSPYKWSPEEQMPGQPAGADWSVENPWAEQPLQLQLHLEPVPGEVGGYVVNPSFYTGGSKVTFLGTVETGQYLVLDSRGYANLYDENWNLVQQVETQGNQVTAKHGLQAMSFSCESHASSGVEMSVVFSFHGEPQRYHR